MSYLSISFETWILGSILERPNLPKIRVHARNLPNVANAVWANKPAERD